MRSLLPLSIIVAAGIVAPVIAQVRDNQPGEYEVKQSLPAPVVSGITIQAGQTPDTGTGQAGQRQTRQQVAQDTGIEPIDRIGSRIQNRVQSRIRNRIDRYYDPRANATSPFVIAGDQLRTTARPRR